MADPQLSAGLALLEQRAFTDAAKSFRDVLAGDAGNVSAATLLGWTLVQTGELDEADSLLLPIVSKGAGTAETEWVLGLVYLERDEVPKARALFDGAIRRSPASAKYHASSAAAHVRGGNFERAMRAYAEAARLDPKLSVYKTLRFDRQTFQKISAAGSSAPLPEMSAAFGPPDFQPSYVLLIGADEVYLRKYGEGFFSSLPPYLGPGCLMHVHALDPAVNTPEFLLSLMHAAGAERGVVTAEALPAFLANAPHKRTWYACRRFYHLSGWLARYQAPIVVVDVDMHVQGKIGAFIAHAAQADIGLNFRTPRDAPWLDISAGCVVANPTGTGREYFRLVRGYLDLLERERVLKWHLDQSALYCVLRMMAEYAVGPSVVSIAPLMEAVLAHAGRGRAKTFDKQNSSGSS